MNIIIKDGTGSGNSAQVTPSNKLQTLTVTEDISAHHCFEEEAYNVNTGTISLTSAGESGVLYFKNLEDEEIIISAFFYLLGTNTGGSGDTLVQVHRNPTGGTLISGGTAIIPVNRNFGSSRTLNVTALKGAEGLTLSGGSVVIESLFPSVGRQVISVGAIILPRGSSIAITITPATSTTAQDVQMAMSLYRKQETTQERAQ